ncbi:SURF1 family protein [Sphingomonas sp. 1P06PA]|uniref:SURF1 family protein n=1 Tax=Sphingomonas sp. 1P06PA TaxID=554121 RepID=UPI0039A5E66C
MKRLPLIPTIIVGLAVAAMIALGIWQLGRAREKAALLKSYAAASAQPSTGFPMIPTDQTLLFRRASAFCLQPVSERVESGRSADGRSGWRHIAACRRGGGEGPGMSVDIGWSADFTTRSGWRGGPISGVIAPAPDHSSLVARATGRAPPREIMLVSATPAPGLVASAPPSPADVPNNHLAYAVQWFLFAGVAALIYGLALRWRRR